MSVVYAEGNMDRLAAAATARTQANEGDAVAWTWLGVAREALGDRAEAASAYERAGAVRPEFWPAHVNLANLKALGENWQDALALYRRALSLNPEAMEARLGMAEIYRLNGDWRKAALDYSAAAAARPADARLSRLAELARRASEGAAPSAEVLLALTSAGHEPMTVLPEVSRSLDTAKVERAPEPERIPLHISFRRSRSGMVDLVPGAILQLEALAAVLKTTGWEGRSLLIEGHTCICGQAGFNVELGRRRAEAVKQYLVQKHHWPSDKLRIGSKGGANPVAPEANQELTHDVCERDEGHTMNRRVIVKEYRESGDEPLARVTFLYRPKGATGFRPIPANAVLTSGDELQWSIRAYKTAYAYAFHHSSNGNQWYVLFPNPAISMTSRASNPLQASRHYLLPGSQTGIPLDDNPGSEETSVCVGAQPLPALEARASRHQREAETATQQVALAADGAGDRALFRGMKVVPRTNPARSIMASETCVRVNFEHRAR
ncbi:MAG: OmpA family protein [Paludibaculum sp.]